MTRHLLRRTMIAAVAAIGLMATVACNPEGYFDDAQVSVSVQGSTIKVVGWAIDRDDVSRSVDVHVYVDSFSIAARANGYRPDVEQVYPGWGVNHGYSVSVNASPGTHQVCVYAINLPGTPGDNALLGCRTVTVKAPATTTTTKAPTTSTTKAPTTTTTSPGTTTTTSPPPAPGTWQAELIDLLDAERAAVGSAPLTSCSALQAGAESYAGVMAANAWFDTVGPDGSDPWTRASAYDGTAVTESIAFGFDTPAEVVANAMASDQASDLTAAEMTHIGVGRVNGDPDGSGPMAAGWYWVIDLGTGGTC